MKINHETSLLEKKRYLLINLPYHLASVKQWDRFVELLTSFDFIRSKYNSFGMQPLIEDFSLADGYVLLDKRKHALELIQKSLRLSYHVLMDDPSQLSSQLLGRLLAFEIPDVQKLIAQTKQQTHIPWLQPITQSLDAPNGPLELTTTWEGGRVTSLAISSEGTLVITGHEDHLVRLWDIRTASQPRILRGHIGSVTAVAVLPPNGKRIASGSADRTIKIWDEATGSELITLKGHLGEIRSIATLPDGRFIISSSDDNSIRIWDLESGGIKQVLVFEKSHIRAMAVTSDGARIILAMEDGNIKVLSFPSGIQVMEFLAHEQGVSGVTVSISGKQVITVSPDETLKIWDLKNGKLVGIIKHQSYFTNQVSVSPDGQHAITLAPGERALQIWDLESNSLAFVLDGHSYAIRAWAVAPDGKKVVSAGWDNAVKVWQLDKANIPSNQRDHTNSIRSITFSPDQIFAASASDDGIIKIWDVDTGIEYKTFKLIMDSVAGIVFLQDGKRIAISYDNGDLTLLSIETGNELLVRKGLGRNLGAFALLPNGNIALAWNSIGAVLDINTGKEIITLDSHKENIRALAIAPDRHIILTGSEDGKIKVWDFDNGAELFELDGHSDIIWNIFVTPDGQRAISTSRDGTTKMWDLNARSTTGPFRIIGQIDSITPDWKYAVSINRTLKVWEIESGKLIVKFSGDTRPLTSSAISSDARSIIAGDWAGQMHFLRLEDLDLDKKKFNNEVKTLIASDKSGEKRKYAYSFIAEYLFTSARFIRLRSLISKNWMSVRFNQNVNYDGFLSDLELAWRSTQYSTPPPIGLQIRYALIETSIRSIAINSPPILYRIFVEDGIWNLGQALSFASQLPDQEIRCETLLRIAQIPTLLDIEKRQILSDVLNTEWKYHPEQKLELAIRTLAYNFPPDILPDLITKARLIKTETLRQSAIASLFANRLAGSLPGIFEEALELARSFKSPSDKAFALANLAPALTTDLIDETLDNVALCISRENGHHPGFVSMQKIAGYIPANLHQKAIKIIRTFPDKNWQLTLFVALASQETLHERTLLSQYGRNAIPDGKVPRLPETVRESELEEALAIARKIEDESDAVSALCEIASEIPSLQEEALEKAIQLSVEQRSYISSLGKLAVGLKPQHFGRLLRDLPKLLEAFGTAHRDLTDNLSSRVNTMQLEEMIQIVEKIVVRLQADSSSTDNNQLRNYLGYLEILGFLIASLPKGRRSAETKRIYDLASVFTDQGIRRSTILNFTRHAETLSSRLSNSKHSKFSFTESQILHDQIANIIEFTPGSWLHWSFVAEFLPIFPKLERSNQINLITLFVDHAKNQSRQTSYQWVSSTLSYIIGNIALYLPTKLQLLLFEFACMRLNAGEIQYLCSLADLYSKISVESTSQIVSMLRGIQKESIRLCSFICLLPKNSSEQLFDYLEDLGIQMNFKKFKTNSAHREYFDQLFGVIDSVENPWLAQWTFLAILPFLPKEYMSRGMGEAVKIPTRGAWGDMEQFAILRLASFLPIDQSINILDNETNLESVRMMVLRTIADQMLTNSFKYQDWYNLIRLLAMRHRSVFLQSLDAFTPVIELLGGKDALNEAASAIIEIPTWWK